MIDAIIGRGAQLQAKAFREGFSKVFPVPDLQAFTADELVMLFGNSDEDWSLESEYLILTLFSPLLTYSRSSFGGTQS